MSKARISERICLATFLLLAIVPLLDIVLSLAGFLMPASRAAAASGLGFRVSPTYVNPTIAVGDETREAVTLQNSSAYQIIVNSQIGPSGDPGATISLDREQVSLKPGESAVVYITINVPENAPAGRRQQTILFDAASSSGNDVAIVGRVGMELDLNVIHPVADVRWSFPHIIDSSEEVVFDASGRNSGNFTTRLEEKVDLTGLTGRDTNLAGASDPLPVGQTATVRALWDEAPLFSVQRGVLGLGSGVGTPVKATAFFIIFPWKLSLMLALMAATAATGARFQPIIAKVLAPNGRETVKAQRGKAGK